MEDKTKEEKILVAYWNEELCGICQDFPKALKCFRCADICTQCFGGHCERCNKDYCNECIKSHIEDKECHRIYAVIE
jgi:hypothetical protein